jgi:hypothetical protein
MLSLRDKGVLRGTFFYKYIVPMGQGEAILFTLRVLVLAGTENCLIHIVTEGRDVT